MTSLLKQYDPSEVAEMVPWLVKRAKTDKWKRHKIHQLVKMHHVPHTRQGHSIFLTQHDIEILIERCRSNSNKSQDQKTIISGVLSEDKAYMKAQELLTQR